MPNLLLEGTSVPTCSKAKARTSFLYSLLHAVGIFSRMLLTTKAYT